MNRTGGRILRAIIAGLLIAAGIGLGAMNPWWVALVFGVPLVFGGIALIPRPTRMSELTPFRTAGAGGVPVRIESITRSSLPEGDLQPTMLTATISPPHDTAYRARWLTSMSRADFRTLVTRPDTTLAPTALPPRNKTRTPEFTSQPGARALLYPVSALTAAAVTLAVVPLTAWHVDADSAPARVAQEISGGDNEESDQTANRDLNQELREVLAAVAARGSTSSDNLLGVSIDPEGTSTSAEVYDPQTGRSTRVWRNSDQWRVSEPMETTRRTADTFRAADVATTDLTAMTGTMHHRLTAVGLATDARPDVEIKRRDRDSPVRVLAAFDRKGGPDIRYEGTPDGRVADFFDPGHFAVSFVMAADVLSAERLPMDQNILTRFEIRGIHQNTSTMYAGSIQSSGGVLLQYATRQAQGEIVLVPGHFPVVTRRAGTRHPRGFAFSAASPEVFEEVRRDAIKRGRVDSFDANAVDIQMTTTFQADDIPVIQIQVAREASSSGTYTPDGRLLKAEYY